MKRKIIFFTALFICFTGASYLIYKAYIRYQDTLSQQRLLSKRKDAWQKLTRALENKVKRFHGTVGLVVEDLSTGWEVAFNDRVMLPSASLVKVPIMISYFYAAEEGKINLNDNIILKSADKVAGSKVLGKEPAGSVFTVEELFDPMITQSDNAAANMLIDRLGLDTLNSYFKKLGLKNTNLARKMMDFKERSEGEENYTTAQDMAYLLEQLYYAKFINKDVSGKCLGLLGQQKINDRIPRKLPKGTLVMHKTGLENHVCHDIGIVSTNKGNFLICVLVKHANKFAAPTKKFISDVTLLTYSYYYSL